MPSRSGRSGLGRLRLAGPVPEVREMRRIEDCGRGWVGRAQSHPSMPPCDWTVTFFWRSTSWGYTPGRSTSKLESPQTQCFLLKCTMVWSSSSTIARKWLAGGASRERVAIRIEGRNGRGWARLRPKDRLLGDPNVGRRCAGLKLGLGPEQRELEPRDLHPPDLVPGLLGAAGIGIGKRVTEAAAGRIGMPLDDRGASRHVPLGAVTVRSGRKGRCQPGMRLECGAPAPAA